MAGRLAPRVEDARGGAARQRIIAVAEQISQAELEVVVVVELPKLAVDHVKVLVREEGALLIDGRVRVRVRVGVGVGVGVRVSALYRLFCGAVQCIL